MLYKHRIDARVPAPQDLKEPTGLWAKFLSLFEDVEDPLVPIVNKVGELFSSIGVDNALYLKADDKVVFVDKEQKEGDLDEMVKAMGESNQRFKDLKTIQVILEKQLDNVSMTFDITMKEANDAQADIGIETVGMVLMPTDVSAKSFQDDLKKKLADGYIGECEKAFEEFTGGIVAAFEKSFGIAPAAQTEKVAIVPPKDQKKAKFYNRDFSSRRRGYSPGVYSDCGMDPYYCGYGYMDPFEMMFWMMIYDDMCYGHMGDYGYMDPSGNAMTAEEAGAAAEANNVDEMANDLSETSEDFGSEPETMQESIEQGSYDDAVSDEPANVGAEDTTQGGCSVDSDDSGSDDGGGGGDDGGGGGCSSCGGGCSD